MGVFDGFSFGGEKAEKHTDVAITQNVDFSQDVDFSEGFVSENKDDLQRRLGNRQIQLLAIGGTIGTALFVSIGGGLNKVCVVYGSHGMTIALTWSTRPVLRACSLPTQSTALCSASLTTVSRR
jgi:hypothetical protein